MAADETYILKYDIYTRVVDTNPEIEEVRTWVAPRDPFSISYFNTAWDAPIGVLPDIINPEKNNVPVIISGWYFDWRDSNKAVLPTRENDRREINEKIEEEIEKTLRERYGIFDVDFGDGTSVRADFTFHHELEFLPRRKIGEGVGNFSPES